MSSKTLYMRANDTYYKLKQDTTIPPKALDVIDFMNGATDNVKIRTDLNHVDVDLCVANVNPMSPVTNKKLYAEMIDNLENNGVTEIIALPDKYKIVIDYSLLDGKGNEYARYEAVDEVTPQDRVLPLGVTEDNECVYRRVKEVRNTNEFIFKDMHRFGITHPVNRQFTMMINDISILQARPDYDDCDAHPSVTSIPFMAGSSTIRDMVNDMVLIFSSHKSGVVFAPITLQVVPRAIHVHTKILLGSVITAYCSDEVDEIIRANIAKKYAQEEDKEDPVRDVEVKYVCSSDRHPEADGDRTPDAHGYYDYYVKCDEHTEGALHVVEDETPSSIFINDIMIHKYKVIKDIPNIQVGEFVKYYREKADNLL